MTCWAEKYCREAQDAASHMLSHSDIDQLCSTRFWTTGRKIYQKKDNYWLANLLLPLWLATAPNIFFVLGGGGGGEVFNHKKKTKKKPNEKKKNGKKKKKI